MKFIYTSTPTKSNKKRKTEAWLEEAMQKKGIEYEIVNPLYCETVFFPHKIEIYHQDKLISDADLMLTRSTRGAEKETYELAKSMENIGIPLVDCADALLYASSKLYAQIFRVKNIHFPKSIFIPSINKNTFEMAERMGIKTPFVVKPQNGTRGQGVEIIKSESELIDYGERHDESLIIQEKIDIQKEYRVMIIGNESLGTCLKKNKSLDNIESTVEFEYTRDEEIENFALKAASYQLGDIFGVDVARTKEGELFVIECNRNPNFVLFREASGILVEEKIIDHCIDKVRLQKRL